MEETLKMALYLMGINNPHLAMEATEFLAEEKIDTVEKLKDAVLNGTLVESSDVEHYSISRLIDELMAAEQKAKFK